MRCSGSIASLAAALALLACSCRSEARPSRAEAGRGATASTSFDFSRPLPALLMTANGAAARIGSFEWDGKVTWSVTRAGATSLQQTEHHHVRQLATGEFEARSDLDPGGGPGSTTGRQVVFTDGMTYARSKFGPFRERTTDKGEGARRFRDQSFRLAGDLARLYGQSLAARPAGEATVLGRRARRYVLSLSGTAPGGGSTASESPPPGGFDADTKRRLAFLEGRTALAAEGELLLDAQTGVPLLVTLKGAFGEKDDPQLRVDFDLGARVESLGRAVAAVERPAGALPDQRKPRGVERALEAAGLKKGAGAETGDTAEGQEEEQ